MIYIFDEIPPKLPALKPKKQLFRFHSSNSVYESVEKAIEVESMQHLTQILKQQYLWTKFDRENVELKFVAYDSRIDWVTYYVLLNGQVVGYTNCKLY